MSSCGGQKWVPLKGWGSRNGWCQTLPEPQPSAIQPSHAPCECSRPASRPPAGGMGRRGGPKWVSWKGGAAETGGAKRCRGPNQAPPDRPMHRVSAAGPPPESGPPTSGMGHRLSPVLAGNPQFGSAAVSRKPRRNNSYRVLNILKLKLYNV